MTEKAEIQSLGCQCGESSCEVSDQRAVQREGILYGKGTEAPGSSPLNSEKRPGIYHCAGCGAKLFSSEAKYNSGTGWPSFYKALEGAVTEADDFSHGCHRIEALCAQCGGHLGHKFPDGPPPTGSRYCMNGLALDFHPLPLTA